MISNELIKEAEARRVKEQERLSTLTIDDLWRALFGKCSEQELWRYQELLDDYIDSRIEERLDQEFNRGKWRTY